MLPLTQSLICGRNAQSLTSLAHRAASCPRRLRKAVNKIFMRRNAVTMMVPLRATTTLDRGRDPRGLRDMLTLRPTGLSPPIYRDQLDYEVLEDGRPIGRMMRTNTRYLSCAGSGQSRCLWATVLV